MRELKSVKDQLPVENCVTTLARGKGPRRPRRAALQPEFAPGHFVRRYKKVADTVCYSADICPITGRYNMLCIVYYTVLELLYSKVGIFGLLRAVLYCTIVPCACCLVLLCHVECYVAVVCHSSISMYFICLLMMHKLGMRC